MKFHYDSLLIYHVAIIWCILLLECASGFEQSTSTTVLDKDYNDVTVSGLARSQTNATPTSPVWLVPSQAAIEKQQGEAMLVTCYSKQGQQTTWLNRKGEQVVGYKGRIHVELKLQKGHSLVFENITNEDKGNYTCKTTVDGKEYAKTFQLTVVVPTSFNTTPAVQESVLGQNMTLRCYAKGNPKPSITWRFNGRTVEENDKYKFLDQGLLIREVTLNDSGIYQCRAFQITNSVSTIEEFMITALVQHKPMFQMKEDSRNLIHGYFTGKVNLTCRATGEPKPTFEWTRDNIPIVYNENISRYEEDYSSTLELVLNNKSMYGNYTCKAANKLGISEKILTLKEGDRPEPPEEVTEQYTTSDSVQMKIIPPEEGELAITGFRVQYVPKQEDINWNEAKFADFDIDDGEIYTLQGLSQDTDYVIRVQSRNAAGHSVESEEMNTRTKKIEAHSITEAASITSKLPNNLLVLFLTFISVLHFM